MAANTFRANPKFKTEEAITQLNTGEALVSFLDEKGAPQMVEELTYFRHRDRLDLLH